MGAVLSAGGLNTTAVPLSASSSLQKRLAWLLCDCQGKGNWSNYGFGTFSLALFPMGSLLQPSSKSCCSYACWAVTLRHLALAREEMIQCPTEAGRRCCKKLATESLVSGSSRSKQNIGMLGGT